MERSRPLLERGRPRPQKKKNMQIYFNEPQLLTQLIAANTTVIVAGRRTGKTDSIATPFVLRNIQRMPGSTGGIVVPTFRHGLTNTLPGLFAAMNRWGFKQGIHYVVGVKPPKAFAQAIIEPSDYERVISFYNGSKAVLISQDRPGGANSLTLSWLLIDEARFIDYDKLKNEVFPANGGSKIHFGNRSYNHSVMILSDMPQGTTGSWFLNYREKMDPQLIETIKALILEKYRLKTSTQPSPLAESASIPNSSSLIPNSTSIPNSSSLIPNSAISRKIKQLDKTLNQLRSVAVYYKEYSTIENLQLLGEKYIADMKRDLTPLTFQTSILCKRIEKLKDGFYSSLTKRNIYTADNPKITNIHLESQPSPDSLFQTDYDPTQPILIGMDYNANINWIVAAQQGTQPTPLGARTSPSAEISLGTRPSPSALGTQPTLRIIKSFYVKFERKIPALIQDFCQYFAHAKNKTVVFYYDSTAVGSNYAVSDKDFHQVVIDEFARHGWFCQDVYIGKPMRHEEKYLLINQCLAGNAALFPMLNRETNEDLLLALQTAGTIRSSRGFRKYKAGEKLAENEENLLEHRTDGTDAFDTLVIGALNFPTTNISPLLTSGII